MTPDVPVDLPKLPKGKRHDRQGGGDTLDPGQAPPPPRGAWPGSPEPDPASEMVVLTPEWLECLRDLIQSGTPIPDQVVLWLLLLAEPHAACLQQKAAFTAALDAFDAALEPHGRPRLEVVRP